MYTHSYKLKVKISMHIQSYSGDGTKIMTIKKKVESLPFQNHQRRNCHSNIFLDRFLISKMILKYDLYYMLMKAILSLLLLIFFIQCCPGYTETALNDNQGTRSVEEGRY